VLLLVLRCWLCMLLLALPKVRVVTGQIGRCLLG
jgi:hypothetical protein